MDMKKRLDAFADAVIAIILTIMVMALPINAVHGELDFLALGKAVGVYAVSFCFVANIWYQHSMAFNQIDTVNRNTIIWDLVLIFFLSLVPAATRAMTTVESNYSVMLYGVLYLIVTVVLRTIIRRIVHSKYTEQSDMAKMYNAIYGDHNLELWFLIAANIVLAYFFPRVAMILFIVITVRSFFTNAGEESEMEEASAMTDAGRQQFVDMSLVQKRNFMNTLQRYIKRATRDGANLDLQSADWQQFSERIAKQYQIAPADLQKWMEQRQIWLSKRNGRGDYYPSNRAGQYRPDPRKPRR
jgi:uncharacterized membrane protein